MAAEQEVAEARQLREEEDAEAVGAVEAMCALWKRLCSVRAAQGGVRLTDLGFMVATLPANDDTPLQAVRPCAFAAVP